MSTGVNPIEAMNEAEQAEELAIRSVSAAPMLEEIIDDLKPVVSSYVVSGLYGFDNRMYVNISQLAQNSVSLAQNVQGADLVIEATDHESADEFHEGLDLLDIPVNF
ncbi:hypothetical protein [Nocardiopsis sp. FIRDI 009]|uniref:hypothetical protein n=1 Tax=Nocardiopsis sp. FIRDI 009 TaxID=714197 RepID=UPI001E4A7ACB|nr:hypothetical protein [Nocardiopsis sp. FIRDI 009]